MSGPWTFAAAGLTAASRRRRSHAVRGVAVSAVAVLTTASVMTAGRTDAPGRELSEAVLFWASVMATCLVFARFVGLVARSRASGEWPLLTLSGRHPAAALAAIAGPPLAETLATVAVFAPVTLLAPLLGGVTTGDVAGGMGLLTLGVVAGAGVATLAGVLLRGESAAAIATLTVWGATAVWLRSAGSNAEAAAGLASFAVVCWCSAGLFCGRIASVEATVDEPAAVGSTRPPVEGSAHQWRGEHFIDGGRREVAARVGLAAAGGGVLTFGFGLPWIPAVVASGVAVDYLARCRTVARRVAMDEAADTWNAMRMVPDGGLAFVRETGRASTTTRIAANCLVGAVAYASALGFSDIVQRPVNGQPPTSLLYFALTLFGGLLLSPLAVPVYRTGRFAAAIAAKRQSAAMAVGYAAAVAVGWGLVHWLMVSTLGCLGLFGSLLVTVFGLAWRPRVPEGASPLEAHVVYGRPLNVIHYPVDDRDEPGLLS